MSENTLHDDAFRQLMIEDATKREAESRRAVTQLIEGAEDEFQYFLDGYVALGNLAMTIAREGLDWTGMEQPTRRMKPDEQDIFARRFRALFREAKSAVRSGALVVRETPMMVPVHTTRLNRWIDMDETQSSLAELMEVPLYIAFDEARPWLVQIGVPVPEMLNERASRLHAAFRQTLRDGLLSSLKSESHHGTVAPGSQADAKTTCLADDAPSLRVRWRDAIVANWPDIVHKCGKNPDARTVMHRLKANDVTGCILPHGRADELMWCTQLGDRKTVSLKTFKNALSDLRKHGYLKY